MDRVPLGKITSAFFQSFDSVPTVADLSSFEGLSRLETRWLSMVAGSGLGVVEGPVRSLFDEHAQRTTALVVIIASIVFFIGRAPWLLSFIAEKEPDSGHGRKIV